MTSDESIGHLVTTELAAMADLGDNYRIVKFLSEGGFGKAYLCEDIRSDDQCVVKVGGFCEPLSIQVHKLHYTL